MAATANSYSFTLYTAGTPNGWKASICLEELGLEYGVHAVDLSKGEQKEEWYLKLNPNGRIPMLVDHTAAAEADAEAGGELAVFESGAILQYLAERDPEHRLLPEDARGRAQVMSWLFWQMGGLGPMAGQADWWLLFAAERDEAALQRYLKEVQRLFGVMERQLEGREWLAAGQFSIADVACFPWVLMHDLWGVSLSESHPNLRRWVDAIKSRPAVQRGLNVPAANFVLHHTDSWQEWVSKARERLEGLVPSLGGPEE